MNSLLMMKARGQTIFLLGFPLIPGMTYSSGALLGPGLHWRDTGDLPPPGEASCATSGACHDRVTLTSSGFQSPDPAHP